MKRNKSKKIFLSVLLAVLTCMLLASCGLFSGTPAPEPPPSGTDDIGEDVTPKILSVRLKDAGNTEIENNALTVFLDAGSITFTVEVEKQGNISSLTALSSSNTAVATVSGKTVTLKSAGETSISATSTADATKSHTIVLTVKEPETEPEDAVLSVKIKLNGQDIAGNALSKEYWHGMFSISVVVETNGDVSSEISLTSSNAPIIEIDGMNITPKARGTTTLTATSLADPSKKHTVTLTIVNAANPVPASRATLKDAYAPFFPIGAAVTGNSFDRFIGTNPYYGTTNLMSQFNSLTVETDMKWAEVNTAQDVYNFTKVDYIVNKAITNNMKMRGHAFVWYRSTPNWVGEQNGGNPTKQQLRDAMEDHMRVMLTKYKDVDNIYCWDVVNEALKHWISSESDYNAGIYRTGGDTGVGNKRLDWYSAYNNSPEYIADAFKLARKVADELGLYNLKLYYNDYSLNNPLKRRAMLELIDYLQAQDAPIDGIGMQAHYNIENFAVRDFSDSVEAFLAKGVDVQVTELDISMYRWDDVGVNYGTMPATEANAANISQWQDNTPSQKKTLQQNAFNQIFEVLRKNAVPSGNGGKVTGVTVWTIGDEVSWLNWEPVVNRPSFPSMFDYTRTPKQSFNLVVNY